MSIDNTVQGFINQPIPLWENTVTEHIVDHAWYKLKALGISSPYEYNTARILHDSANFVSKGVEIIKGVKGLPIYMEAPSTEYLNSFYQEHGLVPDYEAGSGKQLSKLNKAFEVLAQVQPVLDCITKLVRCVQVLKQEDAEIDLSYSSPKIPFTIFVSVCADDSIIANLRVAESILHEAMHLKLTLIESITPLLLPDVGNMYFSPWREEKRPARGVLHGLFVFKAILEFMKSLKKQNNSDGVFDYLSQRELQIKNEISKLNHFYLCPDLTQNGATLTKNLLP